MIEIFPFGQPVQAVEQNDRTPKKAFVLGVYASAVHAQWVDNQGNELVKALAVASEPEIFWRGDGAKKLLSSIEIPKELGELKPAASQFNGPSGLALDELILQPLGLSRNDTWLCDLVPCSRMNPSQKKAIQRAYLPLIDKYQLPTPTVPEVPTQLADDVRRQAILGEIVQSKADTLILLGDKPIQWFFRYFNNQWKRLADFGTDQQAYGRAHAVKLGDTDMKVLPIAHPRQIARLGRSSARWYELHQQWIQSGAHRQ